MLHVFFINETRVFYMNDIEIIINLAYLFCGRFLGVKNVKDKKHLPLDVYFNETVLAFYMLRYVCIKNATNHNEKNYFFRKWNATS